MAKESKNKEKKVITSKKSKGKSGFVKDTKAELKKVIWPNSKQLFNNTFAVITIVIIIGIIAFLLDVCFDKINSYGIDKLKETVQSEEIATEEDSVPENSEEVTEETSEESEADTVEKTAEEQETTENETQGE